MGDTQGKPSKFAEQNKHTDERKAETARTGEPTEEPTTTESAEISVDKVEPKK